MVVGRYKTCSFFSRSCTEIVGSNLAQNMNICTCTVCSCVDPMLVNEELLERKVAAPV
jgi:hypothetical protein